MSIVKSTSNVKHITVADRGTLGFCVVKHDDSQMQRHYVGQPCERVEAIAAAVKLAAATGWALRVKL